MRAFFGKWGSGKLSRVSPGRARSRASLESRGLAIGRLGGFGLFDQRNYVIGAEPFFFDGAPWRVLLAAVRRGGEPQVQPWIARLSAGRPLLTLTSC